MPDLPLLSHLLQKGPGSREKWPLEDRLRGLPPVGDHVVFTPSSSRGLAHSRCFLTRGLLCLQAEAAPVLSRERGPGGCLLDKPHPFFGLNTLIHSEGVASNDTGPWRWICEVSSGGLARVRTHTPHRAAHAAPPQGPTPESRKQRRLTSTSSGWPNSFSSKPQ